mmetsp:Transcript_38244/g.89930  ORF Transcript_38244/g.89930 Transcript_38244/m.89930 type:complete len:241 (-) Transcript_38244:37-759(-)
MPRAARAGPGVAPPHRALSSLRRHAGRLELDVCFLHIVVHDDAVEEARLVHVGQLALRVRESCLERLLVLGAAAAEPPLELLKRGRRHEDEDGVQVRLLDQLGALHVDVEQAGLACGPHVLHPLDGRAVHVGVHTRVLDELTPRDRFLHVLFLHEVVVHAVNLPGPRLPRGVAHREAEVLRVLRHQPVEERALPDAARPADDHRPRIRLCLCESRPAPRPRRVQRHRVHSQLRGEEARRA